MDAELARLSGRIDVLDGRIRPLEAWKKVSEEFHMEMRQRWDHFDGVQEAEARIQEQRHQANKSRLDLITVLVLVATCIITFMGVVVAYNQIHHAKTTPLITHSEPETDTAFDAKIPLPRR